jgi:hypothetical protein
LGKNETSCTGNSGIFEEWDNEIAEPVWVCIDIVVCESDDVGACGLQARVARMRSSRTLFDKQTKASIVDPFDGGRRTRPIRRVIDN